MSIMNRFLKTAMPLLSSLIFTLPMAKLSAQIADADLHDEVFISTRNALFAWTPSTDIVRTIVEFDYRYSDDAAGWSSTAFSNDGTHVAYVRTDGERQWVGISRLDLWEPVEYSIDNAIEANIRLDWMPHDNLVVLSYLQDILMPDGFPRYNTLVYRALLDLHPEVDAMRVWPYVCDELVRLKPANSLAIKCTQSIPAIREIEDETDPLYFGFETGDFVAEDAFEATHSIAQLEDIERRNWIWSDIGGLVLYGRRQAGLSDGLNFFPIHRETEAPLHIDIGAPIRIDAIHNWDWSPDGNSLIVTDYANPLVRHVIDTASGQTSTLNIDPDKTLWYPRGVFWYTDRNHLMFVDESEQIDTVAITSRSGQRLAELTMSSVMGITSAR
jgi:hypothetical protein